VRALTTQKWTVAEWLQRESVWDDLLARSSADRLFLSWKWLTAWWLQYHRALNLSAEILAIYDADRLIGLAPLYRRSVVRAGMIRTDSIQVIGYAWRDPFPLISEYLDVIAAAADIDAVRTACVKSLLATGEWQELVLGFTADAAGWREVFVREMGRGAHYVRELDRSVSYHADLSQGFETYLKGLGQSTRRSVWNLRRRLEEEHGAVQLEFLGAADIDSGFSDLNRLHQMRWNRPAFGGERLDFQRNFAAHLASRGELAFSRLRVGGAVTSVLYDIRKSHRQYNMKMGFDPAFTSRLSLGLVHLGYAMEAAAEAGVAVYDFLAGPGQTSDFKRNLGQLKRELSCLQMLRGQVLPRVLRLRDRVRKKG
jgi:CelD/BcsL family acetyltransferase involved in cellulose biosynthesis